MQSLHMLVCTYVYVHKIYAKQLILNLIKEVGVAIKERKQLAIS